MPAHRLRHRSLAATTLVVAIGFTLPACSSKDSNNLFGAWTLTSASDAGASVELPSDREIHWQFLRNGGCGDSALSCPDGTKLVGNDVCNVFIALIQIEDDRVAWRHGGMSTLVGCDGPLTDTLRDFFQNDSFRYDVAKHQLQLTSSDGIIELTLRPSGAS